ncbi:hypothetical protein DUNSADRAFT_7171, partial [Dunaliella salina]
PKDLASLLDISEADAQRLMDREPALSDHSARRLKRTLKELTANLHINSNVAAAMAVKQPKVLMAPADKVKPRLQHLASLLQV